MSELAIHLSERVLPPVPIRQFVLSLPHPLRYMAAYDKDFARKLIHHFMTSIFQWQRKEAKKRYGLASVQEAHCGAVTVIQRFGSAANLNIHLHCLVLDGVYRTTEGVPVFHAARPPPTESCRPYSAGS
jgi:hypothetical protein